MFKTVEETELTSNNGDAFEDGSNSQTNNIKPDISDKLDCLYKDVTKQNTINYTFQKYY